MINIFAVILGFLLGSIPTGYIIGKIVRGEDIRTLGSGNIGATNVFRVVGKKTGVFVLIIDVLKGILACILSYILYSPNPYFSSIDIVLTSSIFAVAGHNWTPWLSFKGGKGIATSLGVILGLGIIEPLLLKGVLLLLLIWVVTFLITRIVSLSSIFATLFLPVIFPLFIHQGEKKAIFVFSFIIASMVIFKHIPNIKRLIKDKEKRLF
jgi:glycerol-3-phosphate acyltransferase PlsY